MKTKIFLLMLVLALVLVPVISGCEPDPEPDPEPDEPVDEPEEEGQSFTLEFATFWPDGDFQVAEGHKGWAQKISDRVAAETPHTISFNWHYAGSLLAMPEIMGGVADGAADVGTTCPSYTPGVYDVSESYELPGLPNDNALVASTTIDAAFRQCEYLQAEFEDVKIMHFWATGPGDFMTTEPIRGMDDFEGMTIRAVGGSIPWAGALGADTVTFGMGASYENIETGVVDGLLAPTDTLQGFRLAELLNYITKSPPAYNMVFVKVMNWDTWNAFPESVQKIIEEVNEETVIEYGKLRTDYTVAGQEYGVQEYGMEVIELDEDEYQRWAALTEPLKDEYIGLLDDAGLPGEDLINQAFELAEKYSEMYGDYGN